MGGSSESKILGRGQSTNTVLKKAGVMEGSENCTSIIRFMQV